MASTKRINKPELHIAESHELNMLFGRIWAYGSFNTKVVDPTTPHDSMSVTAVKADARGQFLDRIGFSRGRIIITEIHDIGEHKNAIVNEVRLRGRYNQHLGSISIRAVEAANAELDLIQEASEAAKIAAEELEQAEAHAAAMESGEYQRERSRLLNGDM